MILHNVYFWVKDEYSDEDKNKFHQGINDFLSAVPEIVKFEIGRPASTPARDVVDHSYAFSIFVWFETVEDQNSYQSHPAHEVFINSFSNLWSRVQVYDSETA